MVTGPTSKPYIAKIMSERKRRADYAFTRAEYAE